ncbi:quinone oxidoreductase putative [Thozetella sp. PMI_491]|nr:quinone oxidoreductase putative [Thozetella sp. PMI_491]
MASLMKAVEVKNKGDVAEDLFINDQTPKPTAANGQVIVKIRAFGLNRMDLIQRHGQYMLPPQAPKTLGVEFSGTIESFGPGDHGSFKIGDEVFGLAYGGAYAEYIAVSSRMLLHKPPHLTFEQAAGVPETWITATQALYLILGITAGKSILWHAGASGVSIAGIQLSKAAGASAIYATAGSQEKVDFIVNELGATAAFNYKTQDWAAEITRITGGKGVDLIVDFVGAPYFQKNLEAIARDGRWVMLGLLGGGQLDGANLGLLLYKRVRIEGSTLRSRDEDYQGQLRDHLEEHLARFESGEFKIYIEKVLPWEEIVEAHKLLETNTTTGKIICTIS